MTPNLHRRRLLASAAALAASAAALPAWSQAGAGYPQKPVTLIVGFTAGGPTDMVARILADQLSQKFGQSFIVDNKPGANGAVAASLAKKAAPDGYTLMFGSSGTLSIMPSLQKNLPYDPLADFTTVGLVANYPYFLVAPTTPGALTSLDELLKKGRDPNANLSYASAGNGSVNHLAGEWFKYETKIQATHIPYKGDSAAISDIVAGRVDFAFIAGAAALPQVKAGKMRILASASATSGRGGKGIPTLYEDPRLKGFSAEPWNGIMGPAGLPQDIVLKLNAAIGEIMHRKEIVEKMATMEQYPFTGSPARFTEHIKEQTARWATVIRNADIRME